MRKPMQKNMALVEAGAQGTLKDIILDELACLLKHFICKWCQRRGYEYAGKIQRELGVTELRDPRQERISHALQDIGDVVDGQGGLQNIQIPPSVDDFKKVFLIFFADGEINWEKVVTIFSYTCLLVIKAYENNIFDIIRNLISWTIEFFQEKLVNWIRGHGGWDGVLSYFGTPTLQTWAIFLAGVLTTLFVVKSNQ